MHSKQICLYWVLLKGGMEKTERKKLIGVFLNSIFVLKRAYTLYRNKINIIHVRSKCIYMYMYVVSFIQEAQRRWRNLLSV